MKISKYRDLHKYTIDELVQIAVYNKLYNNEYYMSKKEMKIGLYTCLLADIEILIPDNMS